MQKYDELDRVKDTMAYVFEMLTYVVHYMQYSFKKLRVVYYIKSLITWV